MRDDQQATRDGDEIFSQGLRKEPAQRYPTMSDIREALLADSTGSGLRTTADLAPSIAVLPFANLSGDETNDYFGDGLAEDIISALGRVKGLRVIARTSAFAFRARQQSTREIGEKLQVASVRGKWMALWLKGVALVGLGYPRDAVTVLQQALSIGSRVSWVAGTLSGALVQSGRRSEAEALLGQMQDLRATAYTPATTLGFIHANLGHTEKALDYFETALNDREPTLSIGVFKVRNFGINVTDVVRHPRWTGLLKSMNLAVAEGKKA